MSPEQARQLSPGLYRIHWNSGGTSLAAVGILPNGDGWLAPCNWSAPTEDQSQWARVEQCESLDPEACAVLTSRIAKAIVALTERMT